MKVFISWSGEKSNKIAIKLREWLPLVIQSIDPYVSSEDIDKGTRWASDIAKELDASSFGILCVTKDNLSAPWLNFEAGALGKSIEKGKVCPFLVDIKRAEITGPILQFQSVLCEKGEMIKLLKSINNSCVDSSIDEVRLERAFELWWDGFKHEIDEIENESPIENTAEDDLNISLPEKMLEEILELSRMNQKILREPSVILPEGYLVDILENRLNHTQKSIRPPLRHLSLIMNDIETLKINVIEEKIIGEAIVDSLSEIVSELNSAVTYISQEFGLSVRHRRI